MGKYAAQVERGRYFVADTVEMGQLLPLLLELLLELLGAEQGLHPRQ